MSTIDPDRRRQRVQHHERQAAPGRVPSQHRYSSKRRDRRPDVRNLVEQRVRLPRPGLQADHHGHRNASNGRNRGNQENHRALERQRRTGQHRSTDLIHSRAKQEGLLESRNEKSLQQAIDG